MNPKCTPTPTNKSLFERLKTLIDRQPSRSLNTKLLVEMGILALFFQTQPLFSTTAQWISPITPENWQTAANWNPATPPGGAAGDEADFTAASPPIQVGPTVNNGALITLGTIKIDSATNYTINTNNQLTLQALSGGATISITNTLGNGAHTVSGGITLASPLTINQGSTGNFTLQLGIISGAQSITKAGTGTLILSWPNNTYTGGTILNEGTLSFSADNNLGGAGAITINGGTLQFTGITTATNRAISLPGSATVDVIGPSTNQLTFSGAITGAGSLTKTNTGILQLTNTANTYQGGTTIGAGTLSISSDSNLGNTAGALNIGSGTLLTTSAVTSARSGSLTGAAVIDTGGNGDIFSGSFSGAGSLTLQGGGSVALTGSNSYSGGTTIATNTALTGTTSGIQGNITLNTNTSQLTFDQNFDGTYAGVLTSAVAGAGTLTKLGSGTVVFSGLSPTFSGPANINQGTLVVNGSLANSATTVNLGATLSGSGTVGQTTSSGTINPGNNTSVGSLSVNGLLTLNPSSNLNIAIAPLSSDAIAVNGMATIDGALTVTPNPGFYGFSANYTILTSTGFTAPPSFSSVTSTNPAFVPSVSFTATDAILQILISAPFAAFPFSNFNTEAVGKNIDALNTAGQLPPDLLNVFNTLINQNFATVNAALNQMHPAPYSAYTEMQTELSGGLLSLFHRLPYLPCCDCNPNRIWVEPFGNILHMKHHGLEIGFQANSGGVALGYDCQISDGLILGLGGAWNNSRLHWQNNQGHGEVNGFYGGLYFDSQFESFYLGGSFLAGMDLYNTSRHIQFITTNRKANASYSALDVMAQLQTAYLFGSPQAFFYPYANLDYLYLHTYQINEKDAGSLNLTVRKHSDATLRTEMGLGLQVQDKNGAETVCISPLISIGWVNMCPLQRPLLKSHFEGASIPFSVRGWDQTWNLLNANFGLTAAYRCYSLSLQYNAEISPDDHTLLFNQRGNLKLDWKW